MNQGSGLRRGWRSNRAVFFIVSLMLAFALIFFSQTGALSPVEGLLASPLNALSAIFNRIALSLSGSVTELAEIQTLQQRNASLEEALARFQSELVELREIENDYRRLAELLEYQSTAQNQQSIVADVIGVDQSSALRTISINKGTRDGVTRGMAVVTGQGLVGRIYEVSANAARVLLITDQSSAVSARLQTSRAQGSVLGQISGALRMTFIPLNQPVPTGDLVLTSGLGGNFPPDIVIGQVTSSSPADLFQEAQVRSLINFDTLEFVLVITNFQPIDLSVFE